MAFHDNPLRNQVFSIPDLIKDQYQYLEPKVRTILSTQEIFSIQRIILVGCGDSYAACLATKHAFEMLTNIPTEIVSAIELSHFYHEKQLGFAPFNPLVISISNSGNVAQTANAVKRAKEKGAFTLAITKNKSSKLGVNSDKVLELDIPKFEMAPGTRSYMVSVMALLLIAIRIGEVKGVNTADESMSIRLDMLKQGDLLEKILPDMDKNVLEIAYKWEDKEAFEFVGAGFDYGTAWFGHAKVLEALGKYSMHINTEEWLHLNCFQRQYEQIGTIFIANTTNPAHSRNKDVISYMIKLGRPLFIITDGGEEDFGFSANYIKVPKSKYEINMPLTQFTPICLLVGYIQNLIGEENGRGCSGAWGFCEDGFAVQNIK